MYVYARSTITKHTELLDIDGKKRKATLEEGYQSAGYRTGWQVLSNSVGAVAAATLWNVLFAPKSLHGMAADFMFGADNVGRNGEIYGAWNWCPADRDVGFGMSRALVFAALGWAMPFGFDEDFLLKTLADILHAVLGTPWHLNLGFWRVQRLCL